MKMDYIDHLEKMLTPYRYSHSLRVAKKAQELAKKHGVNQDKAYMAGLLHDIAKELPLKEQKELITNECPEFLQEGEAVWHACAGGIYVRRRLGIRDEDIINAIKYHSTGRSKMSKLEMIIYIADYIEPMRKHDMIEHIEQHEDSLELMMLIILKLVIKELEQKNKSIGKLTIEALEYYGGHNE